VGVGDGLDVAASVGIDVVGDGVDDSLSSGDADGVDPSVGSSEADTPGVADPLPATGSPSEPSGPQDANTSSATRTPTPATGQARLGPPNRPSGPATRRPCSLIQNAQPAGAAGQDSCGAHPRGGRQRTFGGGGHPGGVLNLRTAPPCRRSPRLSGTGPYLGMPR